MEPLDGFEPSTYSLRVNCSTPELQRRRTMMCDENVFIPFAKKEVSNFRLQATEIFLNSPTSGLLKSLMLMPW